MGPAADPCSPNASDHNGRAPSSLHPQIRWQYTPVLQTPPDRESVFLGHPQTGSSEPTLFLTSYPAATSVPATVFKSSDGAVLCLLNSGNEQPQGGLSPLPISPTIAAAALQAAIPLSQFLQNGHISFFNVRSDRHHMEEPIV
ncbi:hypothetical protein MLD38_026864 [Melastoma candidum]|uniref:Uncharacterized protein n=1 Tax=Melastoma candidum TaxID=119954 RepID=A0ACB9P338_9MYRT|nr:hypothetical protein MLD38_026864 [Melastoma candidum]